MNNYKQAQAVQGPSPVVTKQPPKRSNVPYNTFWDIFRPGSYVNPGQSAEEKQAMDKAKAKFKTALLELLKPYSKEQKTYAANKLKEALSSGDGIIADANKTDYIKAIGAAEAGLPTIVEKVKAELNNEYGGGDSNLGNTGEEWDLRTWYATINMLIARANLQHQSAKDKMNEARKTKNDAVARRYKLEMNVKSRYHDAASKLKAQLDQIKKEKSLTPEGIVKDEWLKNEGGPGGGHGGGRGGGRNWPGYPGAGGVSYPGATNEQNKQYEAIRQQPFTFKRGVLYIQKLLEAYGLDSDPRYNILMDRGSDPTLPSRPWLLGEANAAMQTIGGGVEQFKKYAPALHSAIKEIISSYNDYVIDKNMESDSRETQMGRKYQDSILNMMNTMHIKQLSDAAPRATEEAGGDQNAAAPTTTGNAAAKEKASQDLEGDTEEWKNKIAKNEDAVVHDMSNKLERFGYKWFRQDGGQYSGWIKRDNRGLIKMFLNWNDGLLYRIDEPKADAEFKNAGKRKAGSWKFFFENATSRP